MKIYQNSEFKVEGNTTYCTIKCSVVIYLFGEPKFSSEEFTVTAKSVCSNEDEFDEVIGKNIAESRASVLALQKVKKFIKGLNKSFSGLLEETEVGMKKTEKLLTNEQNHVDTFKL